MVYFDSDGVAFNFKEGVAKHIAWEIFSRYDQRGQAATLREIYRKEPAFFRNLQTIPQFGLVTQFCTNIGLEWKICSAIGLDHHDPERVKADKLHAFKTLWGINGDRIIFVDRSSDKRHLAEKSALLIDDYARNCDEFVEAGGYALRVKANVYDSDNVNLAILKFATAEGFIEPHLMQSKK